MHKGMLAMVLAAAAATPSAAKAPHQGFHTQIPAAQFIAAAYPQASTIGLAIAVVPDPLVPRYRRPYDLSIAAIELGMLRDGFVLDRYSFPWSEELQQDTALTNTAASNGSTGTSGGQDAQGAASNDASRSAYGLMIFRCDSWRRDPCAFSDPQQPDAPPQDGEPKRPEIRALYLVTDTATQGVAKRQLRCAIHKIEAQLSASSPGPAEEPSIESGCPKAGDTAAHDSEPPPRAPTVSLLMAPQCGKAGLNQKLVILGPNFSGAMDSVGAAITDLKGFAGSVCLVSSATTVNSNERISASYRNVAYEPAALPDIEKLAHLNALAKDLGINRSEGDDSHHDVAILAESSTFGWGVCNQTRPESGPGRTDYGPAVAFCRSAAQLYFPATIADIRYGLQQQQAQQSSDLSTAAKQVQNDQHLSLESGAENGSEFPESLESSLTSSSDQLQLDQVLGELTVLRPKMVIVVATDVRDRLFLFDQLREKLPRTMLVDLGADNLLTHPDFLHASRGALAVSSAELMAYDFRIFGCEPKDARPVARRTFTLASWSTDAQAILADAVARLYESGAGSSPCFSSEAAIAMPRQATLQVVTLDGFRTVSNAFPNPEVPRPQPHTWLLLPAEIAGPIFCLLLPWVWLFPQRVRRVRRAGTNAPELLLCLPMLLLAMVVAATSTRQASHSLAYCVLLGGILGIAGLRMCSIRVQQSSTVSPAPMPSTWIPAVLLALIAAFLACAPILRRLTLGSSSVALDEPALTELGFNPTSGLGFFVAMALATLVALGTSAAVATKSWIRHCNSTVMEQSTRGRVASDALTRIRRSARWRPAAGAAILILILATPGFFDRLGGSRLTVFGPVASTMALAALEATTLCAALLLFAAVGMAQRIRAICGFVRARILESRASGHSASAGDVPGLWIAGAELPTNFAATPVLARIRDGGPYAAQLLEREAAQTWAGRLSMFLLGGKADCQNRMALFVLLATEMSLFRWMAAGTVLGCLSSVTIIYLYPIEADPVLLLNLVILVLVGILGAYVATWGERNEVLSNVLCNRAKKLQVSTALFLFIAVPFIALAAAIMVVAIPGVVDWAGGLLAMLRALGVHP